jgi:hypothetical protein
MIADALDRVSLRLGMAEAYAAFVSVFGHAHVATESLN